MRARVGAAVVAVAAIWLASSCSIGIGEFPGPSEAYGINDAGLVVGVYYLEGSQAITRGFVRLADDSVVDLDPLPGGQSSVARQINEAGTIVGWSDGGRVVEWDASGAITDLGFDAKPFDINDAGVIVGFGYRPPGSTHGQAFVYDPAVGHPVALPELAGARESYAWGINNHGDVVGTMVTADGGVPVRWDLATGGVVDLRPTTGPAQVNDINDAGVMVGVGEGRFGGDSASVWMPGSTTRIGIGWGMAVTLNETTTVVGFGGGRAFRWHPDTGTVFLGSTDERSDAYAVNATGGVVGYVGNPVGGYGVADSTAAFLFAPPSP